MVLRRSRGVQGDRTDRTKTQTQIFTRFGLTWHQKVHFSWFSECQCTRKGPQNLPFCPVSLQDTFIIYSSISHQHNFQKYFLNKIYIENRKFGNLKFQKNRFTNKCPVFSVLEYDDLTVKVQTSCLPAFALPFDVERWGYNIVGCFVSCVSLTFEFSTV